MKSFVTTDYSEPKQASDSGVNHASFSEKILLESRSFQQIRIGKNWHSGANQVTRKKATWIRIRDKNQRCTRKPYSEELQHLSDQGRELYQEFSKIRNLKHDAIEQGYYEHAADLRGRELELPVMIWI